MNPDDLEARYARALELATAAGGYNPETDEILQELANKGHGQSLYAIASWLLHGVGPYKADKKKAIDLLNKAKDKGCPDAWYELAVFYEEGNDLSLSKKNALTYYLISAMLGEKQSMFEAARILYHKEAELSDIHDDILEIMFQMSELFGYYEPEK